MRHIAQANCRRAVTHIVQNKRRTGQPGKEAGRASCVNQHVAAIYTRAQQRHKADFIVFCLRVMLGTWFQTQSWDHQHQRDGKQCGENRLPVKVGQNPATQKWSQCRRQTNQRHNRCKNTICAVCRVVIGHQCLPAYRGRTNTNGLNEAQHQQSGGTFYPQHSNTTDGEQTQTGQQNWFTSEMV